MPKENDKHLSGLFLQVKVILKDRSNKKLLLTISHSHLGKGKKCRHNFDCVVGVNVKTVKALLDLRLACSFSNSGKVMCRPRKLVLSTK